MCQFSPISYLVKINRYLTLLSAMQLDLSNFENIFSGYWRSKNPVQLTSILFKLLYVYGSASAKAVSQNV